MKTVAPKVDQLPSPPSVMSTRYPPKKRQWIVSSNYRLQQQEQEQNTTTTMSQESNEKQQPPTTPLCASCDRCRARKTRCDGKRPCSSCATRYMKTHKVTSIANVDISAFDCVYSPQKRRGPTPGNKTVASGTLQQQRRASLKNSSRRRAPPVDRGVLDATAAAATACRAIPPRQLTTTTNDDSAAAAAAVWAATTAGSTVAGKTQAGSPLAAARQRADLLLQQQQQQLSADAGSSVPAHRAQAEQQLNPPHPGLRAQGPRAPFAPPAASAADVPESIIRNVHMLQRSDPQGSLLYSRYLLSTNELFRLPPTPPDDEYCAMLIHTQQNHHLAFRIMGGSTRNMIPDSHLAALNAARFAELAVGAQSGGDYRISSSSSSSSPLALELCNAAVHCLRESCAVVLGEQRPHVRQVIIFQLAKSFFLLSTVCARRGDLTRYFRYRRICLGLLQYLRDDEDTASILAAMSYLDSWAYMIYNGSEALVLATTRNADPFAGSSRLGLNDSKTCSIASDPRNVHWIQGAPPVYLNNDGPPCARSLDGISFIVRTWCDHANMRFAQLRRMARSTMANRVGMDRSIPEDSANPGMSPSTAVQIAEETLLSSRRIVDTASALIEVHGKSINPSRGQASCYTTEGLHLLLSALNAFLLTSSPTYGSVHVALDPTCGSEHSLRFGEEQIRPLLGACRGVIETPYLLHHAGPTYHIVTNAAVLLCHLLNGLDATMGQVRENGNRRMEQALFETVLDTYVSVRRLLVMHRRTLAVSLRCHLLPRPRTFLSPNLAGGDRKRPGISSPATPLLDLNATVLCACRACQGFVFLAGCSPYKAAERASSVPNAQQQEMAQEAVAVQIGELKDHPSSETATSVGAQFDDEALLDVFSAILS